MAPLPGIGKETKIGHGPSRPLLAGVALALGVALLVLARGRFHFDWRSVLHELHAMSKGRVLLALAVIYACYWVRGARWTVLLGFDQRIRTRQMLASQLMGFTAVALFGRVADLGRPYLIARQLGSSVASQLGVYSVERTLDLAAAALVFSVTLVLAPAGMPHHALYARAGLLSLAATVCLAAFAVGLGLAGHRIARWLGARVRRFSVRGAEVLEGRLLEFQAGLRGTATIRDLLLAMALSVVMWLGIAATYLFTARAFVTSPPLAELSLASTMLLLAAGIGGSLLQLPVIGWFTQTALLAAALHELFAVPLEQATAAGALIFTVANLSVIPGGLLAARLTGTKLRESVAVQAKGQAACLKPAAPEEGSTAVR